MCIVALSDVYFVLVCVYYCCVSWLWFFFFKQKTAYERRISDWSSDVCSSDLLLRPACGLSAQCSSALPRPWTCVPGLGLPGRRAAFRRREIGRASCRERVCQYV